MPEPVATASGDGQPAAEVAATTSTTNTTSEPGKTFTEADVQRIVQERLARAKPADYDQLQEAAAELAKLKEAEKTDLDKAVERASTAEKDRDESRTALQREKLERAIEREAFAQNADADLVALALANSPAIKVEKDGSISGVKEAVAGLLESKPHLKIHGAGRASGGEFGGTSTPSLAEEIASLEAKGDKESRQKARDLKIQQFHTIPQ